MLITEEDLHLESFDTQHAEIIAVAGAASVAQRSIFPVSTQVQTFTNTALADALKRAAENFKCAAQELPILTVDAVTLFAEQHLMQTLVTPYASVGPVAERLSILTIGLKAQGIELVQVRREFDSAAWPYSSKGFLR